MGNGEWGMSFSFKWQIQYIGGVIAMEIYEQECGIENGERSGNGNGNGNWSGNVIGNVKGNGNGSGSGNGNGNGNGIKLQKANPTHWQCNCNGNI